MVEKTTLDIQDQEQNLSGSIAFGAGEYYATQTLAQLIGAFQRQYPAVTFDLFTATADTLLEKNGKRAYRYRYPAGTCRYNKL